MSVSSNPAVTSIPDHTQSYPASRVITTYEDLNYTDFTDLRNHWNLLSNRNPEAHEPILNSIVNGNLELLDRGYSKRHYTGKLSDIAFNLLDEHTWNTCTCSQMIANPLDASRYHTVNLNCGKDRYCPRCSFRAEQTFYHKYSPYWTSGLDFYHITFGAIAGEDTHIFDYSNIGTLFDTFHTKNKLIHKKLSNMIAGRTRWSFLRGCLWSEEAACIDLKQNIWSSHMHCIIASPKGSVIDLSYFDSLGMDILCKKISTKNYFDNCIRYLCKPIHISLKDQYAVHWSPGNSKALYRKVRQSMEILRMLFNKRKQDSMGYFRKPLSSDS